MNNRIPLRYNISSWNQLAGCMSNNSSDLSISVSQAINDVRLSGTIIRINHAEYGTLFACVVGCSGTLVSEITSGLIPEFTAKQILEELEKWGFLVTYRPRANLDGDQLQYLMTLDALGFQKIRILNVYKYQQDGKTISTPTVVAFNIEQNSSWINNGYSASEAELSLALNNGSAMNITAISKDKKFRWDWLDYVANISDILADNQ